MTERNLLLIRGVQGSGKSSLAELVAKLGHTRAIYAADDYFTACDGTYTFDMSKLHEAHKLS